MADLTLVNYCLSFVPVGKVMSDSEASESQHYTLDESAGAGNTESTEKNKHKSIKTSGH